MFVDSGNDGSSMIVIFLEWFGCWTSGLNILEQEIAELL